MSEGEDFSTGVKITTSLDDQSVNKARDKLERELESDPITVDVSTGGRGRGSRRGGRRGRVLRSVQDDTGDLVSLADERNKLLNEIHDELETLSFEAAQGGGGMGGGGPIPIPVGGGAGGAALGILGTLGSLLGGGLALKEFNRRTEEGQTETFGGLSPGASLGLQGLEGVFDVDTPSKDAPPTSEILINSAETIGGVLTSGTNMTNVPITGVTKTGDGSTPGADQVVPSTFTHTAGESTAKGGLASIAFNANQPGRRKRRLNVRQLGANATRPGAAEPTALNVASLGANATKPGAANPPRLTVRNQGATTNVDVTINQDIGPGAEEVKRQVKRETEKFKRELKRGLKR